MDRLTRLSIEAKLHVPVASVYPLEKAAEAHLRLEEGRVPGRIVLRTKTDNH
jgi:NADPH:quinone reductase-like Zn-dependent oxidoreductase